MTGYAIINQIELAKKFTFSSRRRLFSICALPIFAASRRKYLPILPTRTWYIVVPKDFLGLQTSDSFSFNAIIELFNHTTPDSFLPVLCVPKQESTGNAFGIQINTFHIGYHSTASFVVVGVVVLL
jgi:hypothetical protein